MKKAITALVLLLVLMNTVAVFAKSGSPDIKVDGYAKGAEWNGYGDNILFVSSPNTRVRQAHMKYAVDYENGIVYYLFAAVNAYGIKLSLFSAGELALKDETISPDGEYTAAYHSDSGDYAVDAAMSVDGQKDMQFFCEVRVIYKHGLPYSVAGAAQFYDIDNESTSDNEFSFITSGAVTEADSASASKDSSKETTTKRHKATALTTTKLTISTSRVQTTARPRTTFDIGKIINSTEETQEKTAKEKTTKEKTTKTKTTKAKTTKRSSSKTTRAAAAPETVTVIYTVTATVQDASQTVTSASGSAFDIRNLPESSVMKIIAGAAALVLFGAIGTAAVRSGKDGGESGERKDKEE